MNLKRPPLRQRTANATERGLPSPPSSSSPLQPVTSRPQFRAPESPAVRPIYPESGGSKNLSPSIRLSSLATAAQYTPSTSPPWTPSASAQSTLSFSFFSVSRCSASYVAGLDGQLPQSELRGELGGTYPLLLGSPEPAPPLHLCVRHLSLLSLLLRLNHPSFDPSFFTPFSLFPSSPSFISTSTIPLPPETGPRAPTPTLARS